MNKWEVNEHKQWSEKVRSHLEGAISPISGGNDSRERQEKRLIFEIGTIHPHGLNERFSFI